MKETVVRFRHPLADWFVRQMAIVAYSHMMVTRLLPGIEVILHRVAVNTGFWVVAQIAGTLAVAKRECANSDQDTD